MPQFLLHYIRCLKVFETSIIDSLFLIFSKSDFLSRSFSCEKAEALKIADYILEKDDFEEAAKDLLEQSLDNGGKDNISLIMISVEEDE